MAGGLFGGGDGSTRALARWVEDYADFNAIRGQANRENKWYIQKADIDFTGQVFHALDYNADGTSATQYALKGYNGNGFKLRNVTITHTLTSVDWITIFGTLAIQGILDNVIVENFTFNNNTMYCAVLVRTNAGIVRKCKVINADVTCSNSAGAVYQNNNLAYKIEVDGTFKNGTTVGDRGGIVYQNYNSASSLTDSKFTGYLIGRECGGIGWSNDGVVADCESSVDITASGSSSCGFSRDSTTGSILRSDVLGVINGGTNAITGIGGLIALNTTGRIFQCTANVEINAPNSDRVGGLIGQSGSSAGLISQCWAKGSIIARDYVNGFIGMGSTGASSHDVIHDCYSWVTLTGRNYSGGFIGITSAANDIQNCYMDGVTTISGTPKGGFLAAVGTIDSNCYWNTEKSGLLTSEGGPLVHGMNSAQMADKANFVDWDFTDIWSPQVGGPPIFKWESSTVVTKEVKSYHSTKAAFVQGFVVGFDEGRRKPL
jgi:hypothetical protein